MQRREFIGLLGATALSLPQPGYAQTDVGLPLVAVLMPFKKDDDYRIAALRKGLQETGFIEGTNYSLAVRYGEGDYSRMPPLAMELAALNPRVFVTLGFGAGPNRVSPEIPLVFSGVAVDPVALGWVQSYAHPGGMVTGNVMNAVGGEETLTQQRIGLFKQLVPGLTRLGMIAPVPTQNRPATLVMKEKEALQKVAAQLSYEFAFYGFNTLDDLKSAFAAGLRDDVGAFYISGEPLLSANIYSRLMGIDEEGRLARLKAARKALVDPTIAAHRGRIVKTTGDGMLVEFASAVDAARCGAEVQRGMAEQNASVAPNVRIQFRIGIHVGDIIVDDNDVGVNIAARIEFECERVSASAEQGFYRV